MGGNLGLIFAGYAPLACQNPYLIFVYSVVILYTPKCVAVSRLHDTVARFRTGVKFSPRYNNRGELTPG